MNVWAADHAHSLPGAIPVLALDMYEHAYHLDFGADAPRYIESFMRNIDWQHVSARYEAALGHAARDWTESVPSVSAVELDQALGERTGSMTVLDVRRAEDRTRDRLPGTSWRDMTQVDEWVGDLPRDRPVVVYCLYGFWVSQDTAAALRERGVDARILAGGISAWRGMGLPTDALE